MTEYENDGNTYCHGIVNCKYFEDGECLFMDMGSGNPDDMPCLVQAKADIKAFREWREQKEERPQGEWIEFADFVARNVVSEDFSEDVDFYAEVLCRKLVKLGLVKLEGDTYTYCGADMRGDKND